MPLEDRCLLSVSLSGSGPPAPLVGAQVVWTATASGHGTSPVYQFSVGPTGSPSHVVRDFSPNNSFIWNPMQEGNYGIQVTVKRGATTLYTGALKNMTWGASATIAASGTDTLTFDFSLPVGAGNTFQNLTQDFTITYTATQLAGAAR